jgi:hypothetical protein
VVDFNMIPSLTCVGKSEVPMPQGRVDTRSSAITIAPNVQKIAKRLLISAKAIADNMPQGFVSVSPMHILLHLFLAEESANYLTLAKLEVATGGASAVIDRWISALRDAALVERCGEFIALAPFGHQRVTEMLNELYDAQLALD